MQILTITLRTPDSIIPFQGQGGDERQFVAPSEAAFGGGNTGRGRPLSRSFTACAAHEAP